MGEISASGERDGEGHRGADAARRAAGDEDVRPRRRSRRVVRRGNERETVPGVSGDERADGWGEAPGDGGNDERLLRDVPPHW
ncbi:hypothetical protein GCM10028784_30460 [Myceligenerans cantabricum]